METQNTDNETQFNNLRNAVLKEIEERFNKNIQELETEEGIKKISTWNRKQYKKNPKQKLLKYLENKKQKEIKEILEKISSIENAKDFSGNLIITVEWKKSYMWGMNPRGYDNYNRQSESIGGCGYDKLSTATAQILNQNLSILKLLYQKKNNLLNQKNLKNPDKSKMSTSDINRKYLGYGAGYNILPSFEGGVGVSSHQSIIEGLNLKWINITSTKNTDVFMITI